MSQRFEVLDSFRGLAAISVILFHMRYFGSVTELNFFRGSDLFVEFFFVLSGFVLTHGYGSKKNLNFEDFVVARIFRLFPLHIIMLIVFIVLEFAKFYAYKHGFHFNNRPFTGITDPNDIFPNLLLLQSWLPNVSTLTWNYPSWSISVEFYMYIIFFLSLYLKPNLKYFVWFMLAAIAFSYIFVGTEIGSDIARGLSCFFAGSLIYLLYKKYKSKVNLHTIYFSFMEISILALVAFIISSDIEHKSLIASSLFFLQVFIFAFERGIVSKILKQKLFLYFGKLSYSIYMIHLFIVNLMISIFIIIQKLLKVDLTFTIHNVRFIDLGNPFYNNLLVFIVLGVVIFLAGFTYKYIEMKGQDIGKNIRKKLSNKKQ